MCLTIYCITNERFNPVIQHESPLGLLYSLCDIQKMWTISFIIKIQLLSYLHQNGTMFSLLKCFSGFSSHFASQIWGSALYERGKDRAGVTSSRSVKEQSCAAFSPRHQPPWSHQEGKHSFQVYSQLLGIPDSWSKCNIFVFLKTQMDFPFQEQL